MNTLGLGTRGEFPEEGDGLFDLGEEVMLLFRGDEEVRGDRGELVADLLAELRFVTPGRERLGLV